MEVAAAIAAWAWTSACQSFSLHHPWWHGLCPRSVELHDLGPRLSAGARVYLPNSTEFPVLSARWSALKAPSPSAVVLPGTEEDVAEIVKYANEKHLPFLTYNGAHGALTSLGQMSHGIEINLAQLNEVEIAEEGRTATTGMFQPAYVQGCLGYGLIRSTVTGTCECVSYLGPGLGGGHGWLQGYHGLIADQFVSMNVVLADGSLEKIDASSDLWWAMNGAGHNFGIVTSVETTIYDIEHHDWAIETLIFSGDKVEAVYQAANDHILKNGTQPSDVINWSYWLNVPQIDPHNPVIIFYIIQEGVKTVNPAYKEPFYGLGPLSAEPSRGSYTDLAAWTGIDIAAMPCQKLGHANPRFPIYLESYNIEAQRRVYDVFADAVRGSSPFNNSMFQFEGYPTQGVGTRSESAFAFRNSHLLVAPLINYLPDGSKRDREAADLGHHLRDILHKATGQEQLHAYVNYAYGSETSEQLYGEEKWRQDKLLHLKRKYDPEGKFSYYAPIAQI
ncbi:hypothetical protein N7470_007296 [Penicillium chermesinum]|nr:hypothetical protein N7470_007296 [Penicillium chermesinum]